MDSEAKRKILLDLFAHPATLMPMVVGASSLILAWLGMGGTFALFGVFGILVGIGIFATRVSFGLEKLTENAYKYIGESKIKAQNKRLDALSESIRGVAGAKITLAKLRKIYTDFKEDVNTGRLDRATILISSQVDELFEACISQLESTCDITDRDEKECKDVVREVAISTDHLVKIVDEYNSFRTEKNHDELAKLRQSLDEKLDVAKKVDREMRGLSGPKYDEAEFLREADKQ